MSSNSIRFDPAAVARDGLYACWMSAQVHTSLIFEERGMQLCHLTVPFFIDPVFSFRPGKTEKYPPALYHAVFY